MKCIIIFIAFFFLSLSCYAQEDTKYGGILFGQNNNTAKDLHDSVGSTYHSDPDDTGMFVGFIYEVVLDSVEKDHRLSTQTELTWNWGSKPSVIPGYDVTLESTTRTMIQSIYYDKYIADKVFIRSGFGVGISGTKVKTDYNGSGVGFEGDYENGVKFAWQGAIGIGYELNDKTLVDFMYKHTDNGEVRGASGNQTDGSVYYADQFDHIYNSFFIQLRFKL